MGWYDKSETIQDIRSIAMSDNVNDEQCKKLLAIAYELELEFGLVIEMKDQEAKERMKAWKALPEEGRISWEGFKRQWQQEKAKDQKSRSKLWWELKGN